VRPGLDVEIRARRLGVRRPDHAVNVPDSDTKDWKIARAVHGNTVVFKSPQNGAGSRMRSRRSSRGRGFRPAFVLQSRRRLSSVGRPAMELPMSGRSPSPARVATGARSPQACVLVEPDEEVPVGDGWQKGNTRVVLDDADLKGGVGSRRQRRLFLHRQRCTASSQADRTEVLHDRFVAAMTERLWRASGRTMRAGACMSGRWRSEQARKQDLTPTSRSARTEGAAPRLGVRRDMESRAPVYIGSRRCSRDEPTRWRIEPRGKGTLRPRSMRIRAKNYDEAWRSQTIQIRPCSASCTPA